MLDLDGILSVDGIDLYASGAQDIAQSMGLHGQPSHQKAKEFEAAVREAVHAAGKKISDDVMVAARTTDLLLDRRQCYLEGGTAGVGQPCRQRSLVDSPLASI